LRLFAVKLYAVFLIFLQHLNTIQTGQVNISFHLSPRTVHVRQSNHTTNTYHLFAAVEPLLSCGTPWVEGLRRKASLTRHSLRMCHRLLPHEKQMMSRPVLGLKSRKDCCAPEPQRCGITCDCGVLLPVAFGTKDDVRLKGWKTFESDLEQLDLIFFTALASACRRSLSSSLSEPNSGFSYSLTVSQPPEELSATNKRLFLCFSFDNTLSIVLETRSATSNLLKPSKSSTISELNKYCYLLDSF